MFAEQSFKRFQLGDLQQLLALQATPCLSRAVDHKFLMLQHCLQLKGGCVEKVPRGHPRIMFSEDTSIVGCTFKSAFQLSQIFLTLFIIGSVIQ